MKIKIGLILTLIVPLIAPALSLNAGEPIVHPLEQKTIGYYSVILPTNYTKEKAQGEGDQGKEYPACILLHGSGGSQHSSIQFVNNSLGRDGVIYICPRAPHPKNSVFLDQKRAGFTAWPEYGYESSSSIKVPDKYKVNSDLIEAYYTRWIYDCLSDARKKYRIRPGKVVVLGHSQGAAFSLRFAIDYPESVKACFAAAGYYKSRLQTPDAGKILKDHGIYVYFNHNKGDPAVDFDNSELLMKYLEEHGVISNHTFYPDGGHRFRNEEKQRARMFIDRWCRGKEPTL